MAKSQTEYQKLVAEYRKRNGKGPPVGTSTVELRKLLKKRKKRKKSSSKSSQKQSGFTPDWGRVFWT